MWKHQKISVHPDLGTLFSCLAQLHSVNKHSIKLRTSTLVKSDDFLSECIQNELATEVAVHRTLYQGSKVCHQNVHFHQLL